MQLPVAAQRKHQQFLTGGIGFGVGAITLGIYNTYNPFDYLAWIVCGMLFAAAAILGYKEIRLLHAYREGGGNLYLFHAYALTVLSSIAALVYILGVIRH